MALTARIDWLLRIAVAFAFLYPPISAFFNPDAWIGYFPSFAFAIVPNELLLLHLFGAIEVIIALWILSGRHIFWPCIAASLALLLIIVFNFSQMDVLFRDVSILLMAVALALAHSKRDTPQGIS